MSYFSASTEKRVLTLAPTIARSAGRTVTSAEIAALARTLGAVPGLSQAETVVRIRQAFGIPTAPARQPTPVGSVAAPPTTGGQPMSAQIQIARLNAANNAGGQVPVVSTGIFGTLGRVIGGAAKGLLSGGPLGAIGGAASGLFGGSGPSTPPISPPQQVPSIPGFPQQAPPIARQPGTGTRTFGGIQLGPLELGREVETFTPNGGMGTPAIGCPSGFRPNKTSYFLKSGQFVPKGSRCVKVRRRNALNPRALSRAISRVESAKRAAKRTNRITIRKSC